MAEAPERPPEAALIEERRKAIRPKLSVRQAASRADISEGRWRQIALGYTSAAAGIKVPVSAPAETVARMAKVVGVTSAELTDAGRQDAAIELTQMNAPKPKRTWVTDWSDPEVVGNAIEELFEIVDSLQQQINQREEGDGDDQLGAAPITEPSPPGGGGQQDAEVLTFKHPSDHEWSTEVQAELDVEYDGHGNEIADAARSGEPTPKPGEGAGEGPDRIPPDDEDPA